MKHILLKTNKKTGQVLTLAIALLGIMLIVGTAVISFSEQSMLTTRHSYKKTQCLSIAEAGIDYGIRQLNLNSSYTGTTTPITIGNGQFEVAVTGSGITRELTSTAYFPNKNNYEIKKTLRADINTNDVNIQFPYGVQAGEGGISLDNNATIIGDVYSNGSIIGSSGNSITGTAIVATDNTAYPPTAWTTYNVDYNFGKSNPIIDIAQSFIADRTETAGKIALYLKKVGNPSDISIRILGNNPFTEKPLKAIQVSSGTLAATGVTTTYSWIEIPLSNGLLISGVKYWIVIDAGKDTNNYWQIATDSSDAFPNNTCLYSDDWSKNNVSWSNTNRDINFKFYYGGTGNTIKDIDVTQDAYSHNFSGGDIGRDFYGYRYTGDWAQHNIGRNAYAKELYLCWVHGNAYADTNLCIVSGTRSGGSGIADHASGGYAITQANIDDFKTHASSSIINGDYSPVGATVNLGPVKINGNLNLVNNQHLVLTGTIYVTGKINFANNNIVSLDSGYGPASGILITDQTVDIANNVIFEGSGAANPNTYVLLITTNNSMDALDPAIDVKNNTNAAILFAPYGLVDLSNNVRIKETTALKLHLNNGAQITYESALQNILFSAGPSGGWRMKPGSWRVIP